MDLRWQTNIAIYKEIHFQLRNLEVANYKYLSTSLKTEWCVQDQEGKRGNPSKGFKT